MAINCDITLLTIERVITCQLTVQQFAGHSRRQNIACVYVGERRLKLAL